MSIGWKLTKGDGRGGHVLVLGEKKINAFDSCVTALIKSRSISFTIDGHGLRRKYRLSNKFRDMEPIEVRPVEELIIKQ